MIDQHELEMGVEVEKEHTNDRALARKIALDHIVGSKEHPGDPHYYTKLKSAGLDEETNEPGVFKSAIITTAEPALTKTQLPLTSSNLGNQPKPLVSDKLTSPQETQKVGTNKLAIANTPPMSSELASSCKSPDPLEFFGNQMELTWETK